MREPRLVTVLLRLPLFYNPDARAGRELVDWLRGYARGVLLKRFRQKAIYLKFIGPVETLLITDEEVASDS
jgi:hypothetical protein